MYLVPLEASFAKYIQGLYLVRIAEKLLHLWNALDGQRVKSVAVRNVFKMFRVKLFKCLVASFNRFSLIKLLHKLFTRATFKNNFEEFLK